MLAICLGLVWFFLRRRNQQHQRVPQEEQHYVHPPGDQPLWAAGSKHADVGALGEFETKQGMHELHGRKYGTEAPEMEATSVEPETGPFELGDRR